MTQSLKEKKLDTLNQVVSSKRVNVLDFDQDMWNDLFKGDGDTSIGDVIDDLLKLSKQPTISTKKLNELRSSSNACNKLASQFESKFNLNENSKLGFQHSSSKSMTQNDGSAFKDALNAQNNPNDKSMGIQDGWKVSPIKSNLTENSDDLNDKTNKTDSTAG